MWAYTKMMADYAYHRPLQDRRKSEVERQERNIQGQIAIVTGSNHGIGKQTVLQLVRRRAEVIMACRDLKKGGDARRDILTVVPGSKIVVMELDLGDLDSVRKFVEVVKNNYTHINILVNNAGIYKFEPILTKTKDGFESHIGVNHLGHFLLTLLLLDLLKKGEKSRIVCVSSSMARMAKLNVENLNMDQEPLGPINFVAYSNSKLANALFAMELAKRLTQSGVTGLTVYSLCPGIVYTNDLAEEPWYKRVIIKLAFNFILMDLKRECASANTLYCVLDKRLEGESGKFYRFLAQDDQLNKQLDEGQAVKLWEKSEELVGYNF